MYMYIVYASDTAIYNTLFPPNVQSLNVEFRNKNKESISFPCYPTHI